MIKKAYVELNINENKDKNEFKIQIPTTTTTSTSTSTTTTTKQIGNNENKIAVLVLSCNRPIAIQEHLNQLLDKRAAAGKVNKFPIVVSQDCNHQATAKVIEEYKDLYASLKVIIKVFHP